MSDTKSRERARFTREVPEDRKRQLAEAALRSIEKKGVAGISARQIAAEAGVTQGLITHYFGEMNELVAHAFDIMSDGILNEVIASTERAGPDPRDRLEAYLAASFSPEIFNRDVLATWVTFWGLILHSPRLSQSQRKEYDLYVGTVQGILSDLARTEGFALDKPREAAIALTATLDGLWLAWCLNPQAFDPQSGIDMCRNWVEGLRRGAWAQSPGRSAPHQSP